MTAVLETERLFLRELLLNDLEPLAAMLANPTVTKHVGGPVSPSAARQWIHDQQRSYRERGYGYWAVIHRESATLVGQAGLDGSPPELGCMLDEPYWRHGLATEILAAVVHHAFAHLELARLSATVQPKNEVGTKLARALGMDLDEREPELIYRLEKESQ